MCVKEVHNFLSALLFSIETQHTIGYGSRYITTECLGGVLVLTLQSSLGYPVTSDCHSNCLLRNYLDPQVIRIDEFLLFFIFFSFSF